MKKIILAIMVLFLFSSCANRKHAKCDAYVENNNLEVSNI